jgi:hypothetical protein
MLDSVSGNSVFLKNNNISEVKKNGLFYYFEESVDRFSFSNDLLINDTVNLEHTLSSDILSENGNYDLNKNT